MYLYIYNCFFLRRPINYKVVKAQHSITTLLMDKIIRNLAIFTYIRPFHKTLSKSSLQMHWVSVRFYETDGIIKLQNYGLDSRHSSPYTRLTMCKKNAFFSFVVFHRYFDYTYLFFITFRLRIRQKDPCKTKRFRPMYLNEFSKKVVDFKQ